jgi:hypothetical protein
MPVTIHYMQLDLRPLSPKRTGQITEQKFLSYSRVQPKDEGYTEYYHAVLE